MRHNPKHDKKKVIKVYPTPRKTREKMFESKYFFANFCSLEYLVECEEDMKLAVALKKTIILLRRSDLLKELLPEDFLAAVVKEFVFNIDMMEVFQQVRMYIFSTFGDDIRDCQFTDKYADRPYGRGNYEFKEVKKHGKAKR